MPNLTLAAPLFFVGLVGPFQSSLSLGQARARQPLPPVFGTELVAESFRVGSGYVTAAVRESDANQDLNGDGDMDDDVAQALDLRGQAVWNTGLQGSPTTPTGHWAGVVVSEFLQGLVDLNGDGDGFDLVFHSIDLRTGVSTPVGLSVFGETRPVGQRFLFGVREEAVDLNGDGDLDDRVLHVHDPLVGTTTNLGVDGWVASNEGEPLTWTWFLRSEAVEGVDANGDGDLLDTILGIIDGATDQAVSLDLAVGTVLPARPAMTEGALLFTVSESGQGGTDLNGDGDTNDLVAHLVRRADGLPQNLGLATGSNAQLSRLLLQGDLCALVVPELSQGGLDLNGDGNSGDWVVHAGPVSTGVISNLGRGIQVANPSLERIVLAATDEVLFFRVYEPTEGATDLNGDGDAFDHVLHRYDLATASLSNLGLATFGETVVPAAAHGGRFATHVNEFSQGGTDLNGDGDAGDAVVHVIEAASGIVHNLGVVGTPAVLSDLFVAAAASEVQAGRDLNRDGDTVDFTQRLVRLEDGEVLDLGLPLGFVLTRFSASRLVFLVSEASQGVDLNGDGDLFDHVLHYTGRLH